MQRIVPTYGRHDSVKIGGVLNFQTGEVVHTAGDQFKADDCRLLLEKVMEVYPEGKSAIIWDNSKTHHAKILKPFLEKNKDRIEIVCLPPYSPELNKIEELWRWMKSDIMHNVFYETVEEIKKSVAEFFAELAKKPGEVLGRLCS
jgi:transposase